MRRLFGRRERLGFKDHRLLMESLELLEGTPRYTLKCWRSKEEVVGFCENFEAFQAGTVARALGAWREFRHAKALAFLTPALEFYKDRRRERARLNFGDQLLLAAGLLKENPEVRTYFQRKIGRILVDEFQDTDPIQAEILFYLTGTDVGEKDWTRLRPSPGSLFLVGDPKQSIYRFRRADIDTYNLVKRMIVAGGGEVLSLVTNFRSLACIGSYVNSVFGPKPEGEAVFPAAATATQASFASLDTVREACVPAANGVFRIAVPKVPGNYEKPMALKDAEAVSGFIGRAVAGGLQVLEKGPAGKERPRPAKPGDFLVLFRYKKNMDIYARSLEERGVPYEISGSDAFSESPDIAAIVVLLQALRDPADPVFTVAALRGVFFGASDQDLLDHRAAGGSLAFAETLPEGPVPESVRRGLVLLREWWGWTRTAPPSVVLERILESSGLLGYLVSSEMGNSRAGNVLKLVEIVRGLEAEGTTSFASVADFVADTGRLEAIEEMSLTPGRRDAVLLMNLHKAKGLEAPIVILANPAGMKEREPDKFIVRTNGSPGPRPRRAGERPRGYFLFKKGSGFRRVLISQPAGWADVVDLAAMYQEAEEHRLMYVAATRARDLLAISSYEVDQGAKKAWRVLDDGLRDSPALPALPEEGAPASAPGKVIISSRDVAGMRRRIRERIRPAPRRAGSRRPRPGMGNGRPLSPQCPRPDLDPDAAWVDRPAGRRRRTSRDGRQRPRRRGHGPRGGGGARLARPGHRPLGVLVEGHVRRPEALRGAFLGPGRAQGPRLCRARERGHACRPRRGQTRRRRPGGPGPALGSDRPRVLRRGRLGHRRLQERPRLRGRARRPRRLLPSPGRALYALLGEDHRGEGQGDGALLHRLGPVGPDRDRVKPRGIPESGKISG